MRKIRFIGQIDSTYLFGKGRGKDKKKRKSRAGYLIGSGAGAAILGSIARYKRGAPGKAALAGAGIGLLAGRTINKSIDKEKDRFEKSGARSRLGKVLVDAKTGAKTLSSVVVPVTTLGIGALGLRNGIMTGSLKGMLTTGAIYGAAGLGASTLGSSVVGGGLGAGVGLARSLRQPNKKKRKKLRVNIRYE